MSENDGPSPYPGIMKDTCQINKQEIAGKNVILVDDIYTPGCNIDEDGIQTMYDCGAAQVSFYAVAKTER